MTQNEIVKIHLESGFPLTQADAIRLYRIYRLAARVLDLRMRGMQIRTEFPGKSRFACYWKGVAQ